MAAAAVVLVVPLLAVRAADASAPPPALGCVPTTTTVTKGTPLPIPDAATATSTITVSGVGTYLSDLDVTTFLRHTFSADLDITLTSPAGTSILLTTDNGGSNDDVFNGTVWDDDADPGSPAPYSGNPLIVTDHAYSNGVVAPTLTPEQPLARFIGEDPNGVWTLSIADDTPVDTGTLDSWSLNLTTYPLGPPPPATTTFSQTTPTPIDDVATATSTITVAGAGTFLTDVDATTSITHTFPGDLDITITSPAGTSVTLSTDNGATNDDVFNGTVWDDSATATVANAIFENGVVATPLAPEEPFGAFIGEDPNGVWTLVVRDDTAVDVGNIAKWSLALSTTAGPCLPDLAITNTGPATAAPGQDLTYSITAKNQGSTDRDGVSWTDTLPAGTTFVSLVQNTGPTFTCGTPAVGTTGPIGCDIALLPAFTPATFTLTTRPGIKSGPVSNTAKIGPVAGDPIPSNNTAVASTTLACSAAQTISTQRSSASLSGGAWCISNTTISGAVSVAPGTTLILTNATIGGPLAASSPTGVTICGSKLKGVLNVNGSTGYVLIGDPGDDACDGNTITGAVSLANNHAGVEIAGTKVNGPVSFLGNTGGGPFPQDAQPSIEGNTLKNGIDCSGNAPAPSNHGVPNDVTGKRTGQCAAI